MAVPISIPFNRAYLSGNEQRYVLRAITRGPISGDGPFTKRCSEILQQVTGARRALLTTSCTHALEMAAILLDIKPGDEVVVPSFTFVSTINAFVLRGARPVWADIHPDTLNIDERQLEDLITDRTRAIVVVHYAGVACEMDAIIEIAGRHGLAVVEDNAHGLFGGYRGRPLGSFGSLAAQSFHETKNVTCGEGGALLINDDRYVERAEVVREKGTDRSRFLRGQVDKYTWVDVGSSYLPSEILAAFLCAQLEAREGIQSRRKLIWHYYADHLDEWASQLGVRLPYVPDHCEQTYHMFYVLMRSPEQRQALIAHLRGFGILSVFHYQPLHQSRMAALVGAHGTCPVTEVVSDRLLRLPFYTGMTEGEQAEVVSAIQSFNEGTMIPSSVGLTTHKSQRAERD